MSESFADKHAKAVKELQTECQEVSYRIHWLPGSKAVAKTAKQEMVDVRDGEIDGYSVSKKLFGSKHPLIARLRELRRAIDAWRDSMTIVRAGQVSQDGHDGELHVEAGTRLIPTRMIPEFEAGWDQRVEAMLRCLDKVQLAMHEPYTEGGKEYPSILDMERARLGKDFTQSDYPTDLTKHVKIFRPEYSANIIDQKLPPKIYEREEKRIQAVMNQSLETAVAYIGDSIQGVFASLMEQLSNRKRIYPGKDHPWIEYHGAEIVSEQRKEQKSSVPYDFVEVTLKHKPDPKKKETVVVELDAVHEHVYRDAYPQVTDERKRIDPATLENALELTKTVQNVSGMLGPYGERLAAKMTAVRDKMLSLGESVGNVAGVLKESRTIRESLGTIMAQATSEITLLKDDVKEFRRKFNNHL